MDKTAEFSRSQIHETRILPSTVDKLSPNKRLSRNLRKERRKECLNKVFESSKTLMQNLVDDNTGSNDT